MVILADDRPRNGPFYPTGANIIAAMDWLVSEPNRQCFLHYSGHGGQIRDPDGDRAGGYDDTIVPVDYQSKGQLDSDLLHRHLVSKIAAGSSLFVVFDCCHSGSALELPFVYRSDADGNVNLMNSAKQGLHLMQSAQHLVQGGFTMDKMQDAKQLFAGAQSFFAGLKHRGEGQAEGGHGLGEEHFQEDWRNEGKSVFMFSGCRDDQTSADASIGGSHVGAMSWALLKTLYERPDLSYVGVSCLIFFAYGREGNHILPGCKLTCESDLAEYTATLIRQVPAGSAAVSGYKSGLESAFELVATLFVIRTILRNTKFRYPNR